MVPTMDVGRNQHRPTNPTNLDENLRDVGCLADIASSGGIIRHPEEFIKCTKEISKVYKAINKPHVDVLVFMHG